MVGEGGGMEQVFFRLHLRFTTTVTRIFGPGIRRWMEYISLTYAFALAIVLVALQSQFVNRPTHCLSEYLQIQGLDPYDAEILQIRLVSSLSSIPPPPLQEQQCLVDTLLSPIIGGVSSLLSVSANKGDAGQALCVDDSSSNAPAGRDDDTKRSSSRIYMGDDSLFPPAEFKVERSYLFSLEKGKDDKRRLLFSSIISLISFIHATCHCVALFCDQATSCCARS